MYLQAERVEYSRQTRIAFMALNRDFAAYQLFGDGDPPELVAQKLRDLADAIDREYKASRACDSLGCSAPAVETYDNGKVAVCANHRPDSPVLFVRSGPAMTKRQLDLD
jgi:hypothetical protein